MGCPAVKTDVFFQHVEPFMDYRKTVYEVSDQTIRSNRIDLALFEGFLRKRNFTTISGSAVINFQKYLKTEPLAWAFGITRFMASCMASDYVSVKSTHST